MQKIYLAVFLCFSTICFSQENENFRSSKKGNWIGTIYFGTATLKAENRFKINANVSGGFLGKEFLLDDEFSIVAGITNMHVRADFYNSISGQNFITNNQLQLPVSFRAKGAIVDRVSYYVGVGLYASYLYSSNLENEMLNNEDKEKGLGFNFGLLADLGMRYQFTDLFNMGIGFKTQGDQLDAFENGKQEFELSNFYAFEIGIGIVF